MRIIIAVLIIVFISIAAFKFTPSSKAIESLANIILLRGQTVSVKCQNGESLDFSKVDKFTIKLRCLIGSMTPTNSVTSTPITTTSVSSSSFSKPIEINARTLSLYKTQITSGGQTIPRGVVLSDSRYETEILILENMKKVNDPNIQEYWLGFGSVETVKNKLTPTEIQRLKNIGVTTLSYNPEGDHTPSEEFNRRFNANLTNPIVEFVTLVKRMGFDAIWAPLRADADRTSDATLRVIYNTGLDGIALQEQKFIESACVSDRVASVNKTIDRHKAIANRLIHSTVQIMPSRCDTGDTYGVTSCGLSPNHYRFQHCDEFVNQIKDKIDILSIWSSSSTDNNILVDFVNTLRNSNP